MLFCSSEFRDSKVATAVRSVPLSEAKQVTTTATWQRLSGVFPGFYGGSPPLAYDSDTSTLLLLLLLLTTADANDNSSESTRRHADRTAAREAPISSQTKSQNLIPTAQFLELRTDTRVDYSREPSRSYMEHKEKRTKIIPRYQV